MEYKVGFFARKDFQESGFMWLRFYPFRSSGALISAYKCDCEAFDKSILKSVYF